jgi:UDP-2,3-diacylglucosamine pyrophosphatase LpxH
MRYYIFLMICILTAAFTFGQEKPQTMNIESLNKPWTNLDFNNDSRNFHFVVAPDHTGAHRSGILQKGIDRINLMQPEFVVSIGDLIEGYTPDPENIENQWAEFNNNIRQLKMPYFYVAGNHDYTNQVMANHWKEKYGTDYYYFIYKNVLFLFLNSEDGATALKNPDFGDQQLAFIEKILAENSNADWTMVFMHQPLWLTPSAKNWKSVEQMLSSRKHSVFTGHTHQYALHTRNNSDYFVLSTMGGVNSLRGKKYGEFDHFLWVTMTPDGPIYANLMLDGVEDKSVQTAENIDRMASFNKNPPVRFEPVYYVGKPEGSGSWKVVFSNNTKENQQYEINLSEGKGLKPSQTAISKKLAAGTTEEMVLPVQMDDIGGWQPFVANVTLETEKYEWDTKIHLLPYEKLFIEETSKVINIDGNLEEWGKLRFSKQDSSSNIGINFDIRSGDKFIYIAVDVKDSDIQAPSAHANLNQDGAFVVFDPRPLAESAFNLRDPEGMGREWLFMIASPTANEFELGFKEHMPPGISGKGKKTINGYAVEYTIPQALLQRFQGVDWKNIRINIVVADLNAGEKSEPRRIAWQPDWMENYPGSGMFFRK